MLCPALAKYYSLLPHSICGNCRTIQNRRPNQNPWNKEAHQLSDLVLPVWLDLKCEGIRQAFMLHEMLHEHSWTSFRSAPCEGVWQENEKMAIGKMGKQRANPRTLPIWAILAPKSFANPLIFLVFFLIADPYPGKAKKAKLSVEAAKVPSGNISPSWIKDLVLECFLNVKNLSVNCTHTHISVKTGWKGQTYSVWTRNLNVK